MKLFQLLPEKIVHLTCNWPFRIDFFGNADRGDRGFGGCDKRPLFTPWGFTSYLQGFRIEPPGVSPSNPWRL